jgi:hypothetical protein
VRPGSRPYLFSGCDLPMSDWMIQASPPSEAAATLTLHLQASSLPRFFPLCQQGFLVRVPGSGNIRTILCRHLGLNQDYLEGRIQTIFLNGKPVDEIDAAIVSHGDTLALSAAMPGLVGATMRRGGYFAGLRANISHRDQDQAVQGGECLVKLKLFNLLTEELGPFFLQKGIWIKGAALQKFLHLQAEDFWAGIVAASLNGAELDLQALPALAWLNREDLVCLRVIAGSG